MRISRCTPVSVRKQAVGVFAFDAHRGRLEPRAFAGLRVQDRRAETLALRPAQVHAQQHFRPVLRFGAARARLDGEDGVQAVAFAGKQRGRLEFARHIHRPSAISRSVSRRDASRCAASVSSLARSKIGLDVADDARELFVGVHAFFRRPCAAAEFAGPVPDRCQKSGCEVLLFELRRSVRGGGGRQR